MHQLFAARTFVIALLFLIMSANGVLAAPPAQGPSGETSTQAATGTAFTYQGNLEDTTGPVTGSYDFQFTLFDALSGGNPVGLTQNKTSQTVTGGLFSVQLDFGNQFDGTALWLQIAVRSAGDVNGYTSLSPRQPLSAVPYAIYALNVPTHDHWGESWTGTGTGLTLSGGSIGLSGSGTTYGVYGETAGTTGYGVQGNATSATGSTRGVSGQSASADGIGVYGLASDNTGTNYGVLGQSASTSGEGVHGQAYATTGTTSGVYGESASSSGRGVYGTAAAYGVVGESANGRGVQGTSTNHIGVQGNGGSYGVFGGTSTGKGVNGFADATTGLNYGVYGQSKSAQGVGVYGYASDANAGGVNYGVYGQSMSANGRGVYGTAPTYGVQGIATSGGSTTNYGVWGLSTSSNGRAVYGENTAGGYAGYFNGTVYVVGSKNYSIGYGFLNSNGNTGTSSGTNPYSIYASNYIAAQEFNAFSDARIKNIQGRSNGGADLATLNQIEITDYTYKDVIGKGSDLVKKVIGQQVETVYPQAVNRSTDVVPDIYQKAPVEDGWVELATDLQPGERVRLIGEEGQGVYEVLEVTPDGFRTDFVADGAAVFVYGREVDDFRNVDYEAIAMLNVSATQELNRLVEQQAAEIEALNSRLAALEEAGNAAASSPVSPWWLFGGLGIVGLVFAQKRRAG